MYLSDKGETLESLSTITIPPTSGQPPKGTIVCLHGYGANAQDLASLATYLNLPDYQFIFPDAPFPHPEVPGGKAWYSFENNDGLTESQQILTDWILSLENNTGVPLSRTILSGFSQGGAMTLDVGLKFPLAGLVSLSGYLHRGAGETKKDSFPPVLIVHGFQDLVVPVNAARNARTTLTNLGVAVEYQEFNMGHEVTLEVLSLMRSFVLQVMS
ncbi:MAG TPA: serine esterase [Cyanobacteria bacterium UBA11372]|nr:serine esterase [Cyanobacteria bacterium UBA11372]